MWKTALFMIRILLITFVVIFDAKYVTVDRSRRYLETIFF